MCKAIFAAAFAIWSCTAAAAQTVSRCAACHFANMTEVPGAEHLGDWQRSAHARHVIGCEKCHGGDATSYNPVDAHRGVLSPVNRASTVNRLNLAATCSSCHAANAAAFNSSTHHTLIVAGERRGPDCTTCHGAMTARVPSPAALETRCAGCHPAGSPRGEYPRVRRSAVESLNALRARADALDDEVAKVPEHARRVELLLALHDARLTLKQATAGVHASDTRVVGERLAEARRQLASVAVNAARSR